ncbi:Hint domain-containing protein [Ruegeria sp. 2012CJ41-6]|uniref:Hint domain-containing protein n=1 Tax=Ruegeria spongiae TaxID=2942209 RepID=A0ABT0Q6L3_9RHOB|nr:Hint domain-containing protein [Ruegeria spongiae]MCL6285511.1 Hint domain-containing protein [Ruegeria spongiae]
MSCFTPGTLIATPKGERKVEELHAGDRVVTRDNGIRTLSSTGRRRVWPHQMAHAEHLQPVLIRAGALDFDLPERDMLVSPNHRVLVANDQTALYFEEREALAAAKHLTGLVGISRAGLPEISYIHIAFDSHEVVLSDGTWSECFQPDDPSRTGVGGGNAQRNELFELFPALKTRQSSVSVRESAAENGADLRLMT